MTRFAWLVTSGDGWIGHWSPGIGDPTPAGWIATVLYLAAAWSCHAAAGRITPEFRRAPTLRREWRIWGWLALAALGVNKQLDLQSALTELGRMVARSGGWYAERRGVQREFVLAVALLAPAGALGGAWSARRTSPAVRLAIAGFAALLGFVVIRAASFHHVDATITRWWWHGLRVSSLVRDRGPGRPDRCGALAGARSASGVRRGLCHALASLRGNHQVAERNFR